MPKIGFQAFSIQNNDQEFLYKSARVLLRNENSSMIDTIMEQHETGFKGDVVFSNWAIWDRPLGEIYDKSALILCMCRHNFHSKWYTEELNNLKLLETRNKIDVKSECPICRKTSISLEENRRRANKRSQRRKNKRNKRNGSYNESSEENASNRSQKEDNTSSTQIVPTPEELQRQNRMMMMNRLAAFDEDYTSQLPMIIPDD